MQNAIIPKFDPNLVPDVRVRVDYNDDLYLGSFEKSNKIWAGAQKKGGKAGNHRGIQLFRPRDSCHYNGILPN